MVEKDPSKMSAEEIRKEQKKNCPFCKIIDGEVEGKVVYEDDKVIALLDIRPAVEGHILVLPKEHYARMFVLPPELFKHLFAKAGELAKAVKDASTSFRSSIFIAGGAAAGQQSPHFLLHVIPRSSGDGLSQLDVEPGGEDQEEIVSVVKKNLGAMMKKHVSKEDPGFLKEKTVGGGGEAEREAPAKPRKEKGREGAVSQDQLDYIVQFLEQNPQLKELLINKPDHVKKLAESDSRINKIFEGIDLDEFSKQLSRQQSKGETGAGGSDEFQKPSDQTPLESASQPGTAGRSAETGASGKDSDLEKVPLAQNLSDDELYRFVESKKKLKKLMLEDPQTLLDVVPQRPRLKRFFKNSDPRKVIRRYLTIKKRKESAGGRGGIEDRI